MARRPAASTVRGPPPHSAQHVDRRQATSRHPNAESRHSCACMKLLHQRGRCKCVSDGHAGPHRRGSQSGHPSPARLLRQHPKALRPCCRQPLVAAGQQRPSLSPGSGDSCMPLPPAATLWASQARPPRKLLRQALQLSVRWPCWWWRNVGVAVCGQGRVLGAPQVMVMKKRKGQGPGAATCALWPRPLRQPRETGVRKNLRAAGRSSSDGL